VPPVFWPDGDAERLFDGDIIDPAFLEEPDAWQTGLIVRFQALGGTLSGVIIGLVGVRELVVVRVAHDSGYINRR
jgi:hypothetical protein